MNYQQWDSNRIEKAAVCKDVLNKKKLLLSKSYKLFIRRKITKRQAQKAG